jgi:enoyl-CoA hydratase/carnithine racemase
MMIVSENLGASPRLEHDGTVAILSLGTGENRLNPDSVAEINALLDEIEGGNFTATVTTAEGKIWCNGMDLPWLQGRLERGEEMLVASEILTARILTFPMPTVAAVQGHAFGAGVILALAHDMRIMRLDRGYLCTPEVKFGGVFTPGNTALLVSRLTPQTAHRMVVLGHRFSAPEALEANVIDEVVAEDQVLERAVSLAGSLGGDDRSAVANLKRSLYGAPLAVLGQPTPRELLASLGKVGAQ